MASDNRITTAAATDSRLQTLKALRTKLAEALDATQDARAIASLSRQLQACLVEIEALAGPAAPTSPLERLLAAREAQGKPVARRTSQRGHVDRDLRLVEGGEATH